MHQKNSWTKAIKLLLQNWSKQISINENEYRKRGRRYRNLYYAFGAFIVIAQTGALTTLINTIVTASKSSKSCSSIIGWLIFSAVMETLVFVAQGLDKFFNFGAASEQYYEAAKNHNALSRLIDTTLILPKKERGSAKEVLLSISKQFNTIQNSSPNLPPNEMVHHLEMHIYDDPSHAKGNKVTSSSSQSIESKENLPKTEAVELPEISSDDSDDHISNTHRCKFGAQMQEQKKAATRELQHNRALRILEYQWSRLEQHGDEEQGDA